MEEQQKIDILSLTLPELEQFITTLGEKPFRAKQIYRWLYRGVSSFDEMTDLSKALRDQLRAKAWFPQLTIEAKQVSKLDGTVKYLFALPDGNCVESVVMHYHHGRTICVSTEVGCAMGCGFCASTLGGLVRRLAASEITGQVLAASKDLGKRIDNVVMMGIGEPLDNYEAVIKFLKNGNHKDGLGIGYRHITLSTCGLADQIDRLAQEALPITLSISLHAPFDPLRDTLMPVNKRYPIPRLIQSCKDYIAATGRRISFEYAMISGVNDTDECARALASLLRGLLCHVNLIPVNNVRERNYRRSGQRAIDHFSRILESRGIPVTIRRELGSDISAACGQLRRDRAGKTENEQ